LRALPGMAFGVGNRKGFHAPRMSGDRRCVQ
jgi:hypothetical protein